MVLSPLEDGGGNRIRWCRGSNLGCFILQTSDFHNIIMFRPNLRDPGLVALLGLGPVLHVNDFGVRDPFKVNKLHTVAPSSTGGE